MSGDPSGSRPSTGGRSTGHGVGRPASTSRSGPAATTGSTPRVTNPPPATPAERRTPGRSPTDTKPSGAPPHPSWADELPTGPLSTDGPDFPKDAAPPTGAMVTAVPHAGVGAVRKARLSVSQVDPWSVMKISFVLSLAGGIVLIVAVWLLWQLLAGGGVFVSVDRTVGDITGSGSSVSVVQILSLRRVMGVALMLAVIQVVLITALATLCAFLYNLTSGLVGGLEVTLSEEA